MSPRAAGTLLFLLAVISASAQDILQNNNFIQDHDAAHKFGCGCMEYWTCVMRYLYIYIHCYFPVSRLRKERLNILPSLFLFRGGQPYSYCGINDREVCCFVPENAEPVGILPTPTRSRCGQKGFDTGSEGEADMAEWPWHVSACLSIVSWLDVLVEVNKYALYCTSLAIGRAKDVLARSRRQGISTKLCRKKDRTNFFGAREVGRGG